MTTTNVMLEELKTNAQHIAEQRAPQLTGQPENVTTLNIPLVEIETTPEIAALRHWGCQVSPAPNQKWVVAFHHTWRLELVQPKKSGWYKVLDETGRVRAVFYFFGEKSILRVVPRYYIRIENTPTGEKIRAIIFDGGKPWKRFPERNANEVELTRTQAIRYLDQFKPGWTEITAYWDQLQRKAALKQPLI